MYVYIYIHIYRLYIYIYILLHIHMYILCICICVYIYIYMYTVTYTYMRIRLLLIFWDLLAIPIQLSFDPPEPRFYTSTVSFHNFKSQNIKLSVSNPKSKYVAYLSVLSQISNCQSLGRKNKHENLKTDRIYLYRSVCTSIYYYRFCASVYYSYRLCTSIYSYTICLYVL